MNARGVTYVVVHDDADPAAARAFWRTCSSAAKISATMVVVNRAPDPDPDPDRLNNATSTRRKRKLSSSGGDR